MVTMIDRRSRLLLAQRSTGRKALPVLETLKAMFAKIPREIRHTVLLIEEKNSTAWRTHRRGNQPNSVANQHPATQDVRMEIFVGSLLVRDVPLSLTIQVEKIATNDAKCFSIRGWRLLGNFIYLHNNARRRIGKSCFCRG